MCGEICIYADSVLGKDYIGPKSVIAQWRIASFSTRLYAVSGAVNSERARFTFDRTRYIFQIGHFLSSPVALTSSANH